MSPEELILEVSDATGVPATEISLDTPLIGLPLDSLEFVSLMTTIGVPRDAYVKVNKVGDLLDYIPS